MLIGEGWLQLANIVILPNVYDYGIDNIFYTVVIYGHVITCLLASLY